MVTPDLVFARGKESRHISYRLGHRHLFIKNLGMCMDSLHVRRAGLGVHVHAFRTWYDWEMASHEVATVPVVARIHSQFSFRHSLFHYI